MNWLSTLMCRAGHHKPEQEVCWNGGYAFTRCQRCRCDLVRSLIGNWQKPKNYRVVWRLNDNLESSPMATTATAGKIGDELSTDPSIRETGSTVIASGAVELSLLERAYGTKVRSPPDVKPSAVADYPQLSVVAPDPEEESFLDSRTPREGPGAEAVVVVEPRSFNAGQEVGSLLSDAPKANRDTVPPSDHLAQSREGSGSAAISPFDFSDFETPLGLKSGLT